MTRYILDTDSLTLLQQLHPNIVQRISGLNPDDIAITIVTVEEQLRGWLNAIRQSSQAERLIWAYLGFRDTVNYLNRLNILEFDRDASDRFNELRRQKVRIGTQDLRIAAIALSKNAVLVTRNQRDFRQVPSLVFEDWSR